MPKRLHGSRTAALRNIKIASAIAFLAAISLYHPHNARSAESYDTLIRHATIFDGSGAEPHTGDIAIAADHIAAIGNLKGATAKRIIDGTGLAVSPGFIDMLGQSEFQLVLDHRALSKVSQGVTTEITGEGNSIAPQNDTTLAPLRSMLDHYHLTVDWTDLAGYFRRVESMGIPINIGTYVGATQVRVAVLGEVDRAPNAAELNQMKQYVAQAMQQGAFGISTSLIYPPAHYAKTDELIALAKVASEYGGLYATHMRSEGATETAALDEAMQIGREAHLPVEIFHMKVTGKSRWGSMPAMIAKIEAAQRSGLNIAADMYPYVAGGSYLAASLPPWVADGGPPKLLERLRDPKIREKIKSDMAEDHAEWENLYFDCGGPTGVVLASVANPDLKKYTGLNIAEIAALQKKDPLDALFDLIVDDNDRSSALYFLAGEDDLQYGLKQSWTSIGSDAGATSLDGPTYQPHTHPRAWGTMPRFLGHYARDMHMMPMQEAIRKMTSLPASREHLDRRGLLKEGYFADVVVFDAAHIVDNATYSEPNQLSTGIKFVFVNGQLEFEDGKETGVMAGKPLHGRGWKQAAAK